MYRTYTCTTAYYKKSSSQYKKATENSLLSENATATALVYNSYTFTAVLVYYDTVSNFSPKLTLVLSYTIQ